MATPAKMSAESSNLTPDQQALKVRAERFGISFDPKSAPKRSTPAKGASTPTAPSVQPKAKPATIDAAPLGISEEVLAKRAAKFGLPEKKETTSTETATARKSAMSAKNTAEITP